MNINKYFKVSTIASVITSLLLFSTPTKALKVAQPRRIAIFVNGYQDCCASEMDETKTAFTEMGIKWFDNAWDSVFQISRVKKQLNHGEIDDIGTKRFINQMSEYLSSLPEGTEIFLIGHSFGGDSILSFLDSYNNYRTKGKGAVKIRLAAVIDPVGYAGTRADAISNEVGSNVEYFFNRWQTNNVPPVDYANSNGWVKNCRATVECDEKEHSTARNRDGIARKVNCGKLEFGCEGAKWISQGINSRYDPGRKDEPRRHNDMPSDDFIEAQIIDIVNNLVATVSQTSSSDFVETLDIPIVHLNRPNSFEARFRSVNDWAGRQDKYVAGFPNFHQAPGVFGTVLFRKSNSVEERGIPISELGNPRNNEERFRAVNDWASRNGYGAAFPNFHQGNSSQGVVHGTVLLKKEAVESKDIPVSELGNPRNNEERFRAVNDWAFKNGYAAGFPNFHQADYGQGVVYGAILIKKKNPYKAEVKTTVFRPKKVSRSCSTDYLRFQIINNIEPNNFRYKFSVDSDLPSHELLAYARFTKDTKFIQTFTVKTGLGYPTELEPCPTNPVVTINGKKVYIDRLGKLTDNKIPRYVFVKQVDGSFDLLYTGDYENVKSCFTTSLSSDKNIIFGAYWNDREKSLSTCPGNSHR